MQLSLLTVTKLLRRTPAYGLGAALLVWPNYLHWLITGRPAPPPHKFKQQAVRRYAQRFACETLVETGTFRGDMLAAVRNDFAILYSIELSRDLHRKAVLRFKNFRHINLLHGDSSRVLADIIPVLRGKALFWLDGHYSGGITALGQTETPVIDELDLVLRIPDRTDVILVDDARCFDGKNGWPTVEDLRAFVAARRPDCAFDVRDDIIRITPRIG